MRELASASSLICCDPVGLEGDIRHAQRCSSVYPTRRKRSVRMPKNQVFIERREQGDYAVRKPGSERASAVLPTQAKAIERAREMNPDAAVHVERVRDTNVGGRDKWRKI